MQHMNLIDPEPFSEAFQRTIQSVHLLLEETCQNIPRESDELDERSDKHQTLFGFKMLWLFENPEEFLQCFLDMIRVYLDPNLLGTFLLNGNPDFVRLGLPAGPFHLGYASLLSEPGQPFSEFWNENVLSQLHRRGYDFNRTRSVYVVVSAGTSRYNLNLIDEVNSVLGSGFSSDEVFQLMASAIDDSNEPPDKGIYSGFCLVPELEQRLRVSLWLMLLSQESQLASPIEPAVRKGCH